MRALILGLTMCLALAHAPWGAWATEPGKFEFLGLRPGMTLDQVKQAVQSQKLGLPKISPAPSFTQKVALARNERVAPGDYQGVQTLQIQTGDNRIDVIFVAMPEGSVAMKIVVDILAGTNERALSETFVSKYGPPDRKTDHEWIWGDTATYFYARKAAYLEFQPSPASTSRTKPIAAVIVADPAIEKAAKEAVEKQARP